jgi:hypothetical protein
MSSRLSIKTDKNLHLREWSVGKSSEHVNEKLSTNVWEGAQVIIGLTNKVFLFLYCTIKKKFLVRNISGPYHVMIFKARTITAMN